MSAGAIKHFDAWDIQADGSIVNADAVSLQRERPKQRTDVIPMVFEAPTRGIFIETQTTL